MTTQLARVRVPTQALYHLTEASWLDTAFWKAGALVFRPRRLSQVAG